MALAEARSLTFKNRLIIIGSTPLLADTSRVARSFAESDQHVYECRCSHCREFAELRWPHFEWRPGQPDSVVWCCPLCGGTAGEESKPQMVAQGRWRALRPEVTTTHRGYRLSALVSSLPHATWPKLVAQWEAAQGDDERMKAFVNTLLGEAWTEPGDGVDEAALAARAEPFDLDNIPSEVLAITVGVDVQQDRFEATVVGWARDGAAYVLAHEVLWTDPTSDEAWSDLDAFLRQRWQHPNGGMLKIDAAAIDAGDGGVYDVVLRFCQPRISRKILAIKGVPGFARAAIQRAKLKRGSPLFLVGVDSVKAQLFAKLGRGRGVRFSNTLGPEYYEQLTSERRIVRLVRGKPTARFERKPGMKAEALDAMVYATAARAALTLSAAAFDQREDELRAPAPPKPMPSVIRSQWMDRL